MSKRNERTASGTTRVRIITDGPCGLCGEVADIPTELVAAYEASLHVDSNPDAVAYAESVIAKRAQSAG